MVSDACVVKKSRKLENALRKLEILSFKENWAENLRVFEMENIYVETAHPTEKAKTQAYILLNQAGKDAIERARSFTCAQGKFKEYSSFLKAGFKALCEPQTNITMLRHRFKNRNQKWNETFQSYLVDLRNEMFVNWVKKNKYIRDRIFVGISSDTVRKFLL